MENRSCFARLLDVRGYVIAARASLMHATPATALFMMLLFGIIALCILPLWITYDLASTWEFTTGLRDTATPAINDVSRQVDLWLDISVGRLLAATILTSFTLLPSLFELAFPTVNHPLLNIILFASIIFDYVTDWHRSWELAGTWTDSTSVQFIYTIPTCAFMSVGLQALLVICATVVLFSVVALVRGGAREAQAVIIQR